MRKKSYIVFIVLVAFLLTVSSCKQSSKNQGPFKGGVKGVDMSFLPTAPPSEFNVGNAVPVKVLLKNNGEKDVETGQAEVQVFGIHYPSFGLSDQYKPTEGKLVGITPFVNEGGEQQVDLGIIGYNQQIGNFEEFQLKAKVCYPYETQAQVKACISSIQLEEGKSDKVCNIDGNKISPGDVSSAPIQVTSVTERFRGADQLLLDITIENKGNGKVYRPGLGCSDLDDQIKRADSENIINVKTSVDLSCSFLGQNADSGELRLTDGKKTLTCLRTVEGSGSNFEQKITIFLNYKYVDTTSKTIKIFQTTT